MGFWKNGACRIWAFPFLAFIMEFCSFQLDFGSMCQQPLLCMGTSAETDTRYTNVLFAELNKGQ